MGAYVCKKPLTLSGVPYMPGDILPAGAVVPGRELALKRNGCIVEVDMAEPSGEAPDSPGNGREAVSLILLPIDTPDGLVDTEFAAESVRAAVSITQLAEKDAKTAVSCTADADALTLLAAIDRRKAVDAAVRDRLAAIEAQAEEAAGGDSQNGADV